MVWRDDQDSVGTSALDAHDALWDLVKFGFAFLLDLLVCLVMN